MPIVRVEPAGYEIDVQPGESVAEAAWRLGYYWPTVCWGQAECMTCFVTILDGIEQAEQPQEDEYYAIRTLMTPSIRGPKTRLACRLRVLGEGLVVKKAGVRPPEAGVS